MMTRDQQFMNKVALIAFNQGELLACPDCSALYQYQRLAKRQKAYCVRCGAFLYRSQSYFLSKGVALVLTALILLVISHLYPILVIRSQAITQELTLMKAIAAYWDGDLYLLSFLLTLNLLIFPLWELLSVLWILLTLRFQWRPAVAIRLLRWMHELKPWGMLEVFMLSTLVALSKLGSMAQLLLDVAFWSFAALMVVILALHQILTPFVLWRSLAQLSRSHQAKIIDNG